ncbi:MAG: aminotransferase class V-fold PLP-dependent enzyme [Legionellales bacterium]|nr:aminotransferase class V-fold PLP-dependent enzyme [Legionellales bacterium]
MQKTKPIYLDYMATTPVDPLVLAQMLPYFGPEGCFANASSRHQPGQQAAVAVETAREQIAQVVGTTSDALVFTSGATEANNLAILGAARFYQRKGRHLITMSTEHKSVLEPFQQLEREGFTVTYLPPQTSGLLDLDLLQSALRPDTILVSIMHVNNEIGVIQDIPAIGALLKKRGIVFHVDAAQSAGRLAIDLNTLPVHLMSFSAHKNYGPKGIGALFIRQKPRIRLQTLSFGGGQEHGLRAGTLPTHQIVGMGAAFALSESLRVSEQARILELRTHLWAQLKAIPGIVCNGSLSTRIAGNLNISITGIDGEQLLPALHNLAVSSMTACATSSTHPSYVLRALGVDDSLAKSSLRLSIGRFTTAADLENAFEILRKAIVALR